VTEKTSLQTIPEEKIHKTIPRESMNNGNAYTNISLDESDYEVI
jgi:hypothetical protein